MVGLAAKRHRSGPSHPSSGMEKLRQRRSNARTKYRRSTRRSPRRYSWLEMVVRRPRPHHPPRHSPRVLKTPVLDSSSSRERSTFEAPQNRLRRRLYASHNHRLTSRSTESWWPEFPLVTSHRHRSRSRLSHPRRVICNIRGETRTRANLPTRPRNPAGCRNAVCDLFPAGFSTTRRTVSTFGEVPNRLADKSTDDVHSSPLFPCHPIPIQH
jgi:hypothetical protein